MTSTTRPYTGHVVITKLAHALTLALFTLACVAALRVHAAEPYPSKPVKVIVPYSVGGVPTFSPARLRSGCRR